MMTGQGLARRACQLYEACDCSRRSDLKDIVSKELGDEVPAGLVVPSRSSWVRADSVQWVGKADYLQTFTYYQGDRKQ